MFDFITIHESLVRLFGFIMVLVVFLSLEWLFPRRASIEKSHRWISNFSLVVINSVLLKLVMILVGISASTLANENQLGFFHWWQTDFIWQIVFSLVALDMAIYWQHRLLHLVPALWRLHRVHHTDLDYDVSTALRFHPIEIILSFFVKFIIVLLIGVPLVALIVFEVVLNATAIFNHSNIKLPIGLDKYLRFFIVTPDMHRVHHSIHPRENNSNYGFNISLWDRLFGSYVAQPKDGHESMQIGLSQFRAADEQTISALISQPIKNNINHT